MQASTNLNTTVKNSNLIENFPVLAGGLAPYTGPWTKKEAAHLLRRTTFGPNQDMINRAVSLGLSGTLDELFKLGRFPQRPLNHNNTNDTEVPLGATWINADQSPANGLNMYRIQSLTSWYLLKLQSNEFNILEKMVLFWHNHFVVSDIESPALFYNYFETLEKDALGNFKQLTKDITISAAMLRYLNGNVNTATTLNENFAREILELFTIGKGVLAGPGDYTTFTETDVRALTKVFTGWSFMAPYKIEVSFDPAKHDKSLKTLSHRFGNKTIADQGKLEYSNAIDIIFEQTECSRFIARELYRWFIHYSITPQVEKDIIEHMAAIIRLYDYDILTALKTLLGSEHFFSDAAYGCMIKSPLDFIMSLSNSLKFPVPSTLLDQYTYFSNLWTNIKLMGQTVSEIPDVAGWKAYYQEPLYYRHWINSVSLQERKIFVDQYIQIGIKVNQSKNLKIPVLQIVAELPEPNNINKLIVDLVDLILTHPLTDSQSLIAKEVILNGLPDYEWTVEYDEYKADPTNTRLKDAIESKLRSLFLHVLNLPEFLLH